MPSGTPTRIASPKPLSTRLSVATTLSMRPRSVKRTGTLRTTSIGLGSSTGDTARDSGVSPAVSAHQTATTTATPSTPRARRMSGGGSARSLRRSRNATCASLRFERIDLDLDAAVLREVVGVVGIGGPVPAASHGGELVRLERGKLAEERLLHGVGPPEGQLLHVGGGHRARSAHGGVGVALDDDPRRAELAGEFSRLLDHEGGVRIVELLDRLAVRRLLDLLVQLVRVGVELDDDRLGEDLVPLGLQGRGRGGHELHLVFVLLVGIERLGAELLDDREVHHLVERHRVAGRAADLAVEEIGGVPGPLEIRRIVLVEEELAVLGIVG